MCAERTSSGSFRSFRWTLKFGMSVIAWLRTTLKMRDTAWTEAPFGNYSFSLPLRWMATGCTQTTDGSLRISTVGKFLAPAVGDFKSSISTTLTWTTQTSRWEIQRKSVLLSVLSAVVQFLTRRDRRSMHLVDGVPSTFRATSGDT